MKHFVPTSHYVACVRGMHAWKQLEVVRDALKLSGVTLVSPGVWESFPQDMRVRTAYGCGEAELHIEDRTLVYFHERSDHILSSLLTEADFDPKLWVFSVNLRKVLDELCGTP